MMNLVFLYLVVSYAWFIYRVEIDDTSDGDTVRWYDYALSIPVYIYIGVTYVIYIIKDKLDGKH